MPDDPLISDLASNLAAVSVSAQNTPALVFGDFRVSMAPPLDVDPALLTLISADKARFQEQIADITSSDAERRQDFADMRESQENIIASLEEFKQQMRSVLPQLPRAPGPTDKEVVAALLDTRASRKQAVGDFGWKWAMELEDKQLLPLPAYQDRDFLN